VDGLRLAGWLAGWDPLSPKLAGMHASYRYNARSLLQRSVKVKKIFRGFLEVFRGLREVCVGGAGGRMGGTSRTRRPWTTKWPLLFKDLSDELQTKK